MKNDDVDWFVCWFCGCGINCGAAETRLRVGEGKGEVMFGGGYKKKKILKLAKEYASKRELGWQTYYREMSGLLR